MDRLENEDAAVEHVADRLVTEFPEIPQSTVHAVVNDLHESFDDAVVRDYVPLIVEHDAKDQLRDANPSAAD